MWQSNSLCNLAVAAALLVASGFSVPCCSQDAGLRTVAPMETKTPQLQPQPERFYALVIGINEYQNLNKLQTAENDAEAVAQVLEHNYHFEVKRLMNATRNAILTSMNDYRRTLSENSSLLIYYAGHGHRDPENREAYWLPADATSDNNANWISAADISADLRAMPSRHILIISDSCYSGALAGGRSAESPIMPSENDRKVQNALSRKSRTLMASGSDQPVTDVDQRSNRSNHSVFANAVLDGLEDMQQAEFTANDLFNQEVDRVVEGNSEQQMPKYSPVANSGDEYGDFVFVRGGGIGTVVVLAPPPPPTLNPETDAIASTLHRYEEAYADESVDELKKVWPTINKHQEKDIKNTFNKIHAMKVHLDCKSPAVTGQEAQVNCSQGMRYTQDGKLMPWQRNPVELMLNKSNSGWLIAAVQEAPKK